MISDDGPCPDRSNKYCCLGQRKVSKHLSNSARTKSSRLWRVPGYSYVRAGYPYVTAIRGGGIGHPKELLSVTIQPVPKPLQLPENRRHFLCRRRMHLHPDRLFASVPWSVANPIVPSRCVGVTGLLRQCPVQINASRQSARVSACHVRTMPTFQALYACTIGTVHRRRRVLYSLPERHESTAATRFATSATVSPTCPENSVRPPHPPSATLSEPGSRSDMSSTVPSRLK